LPQVLAHLFKELQCLAHIKDAGAGKKFKGAALKKSKSVTAVQPGAGQGWPFNPVLMS
jgi:hypothetical protein